MRTKEEAHGKAKMKDRLLNHFGKEIHFNGGSSNFMLTRNDESILRDSHDCQEIQEVDREKRLIFKTAAKLFQETFSKGNIRAMNIQTSLRMSKTM